jgi:hypothetical protein
VTSEQAGERGNWRKANERAANLNGKQTANERNEPRWPLHFFHQPLIKTLY